MEKLLKLSGRGSSWRNKLLLSKGIAIFLMVIAIPFLFLLSGCQSLTDLSEEDEIKIGKQAAETVEKQYGLMNNPQQQERVTKIGAELAKFAERKVPYSFKIIKMKEENAFALPGGPIYVTQGLIESGISDDALAGILGHEITHIEKKHFVKYYKRVSQEDLAALAILIATRGEAQQTLGYIQLFNELVFHPQYSRDDEREADMGGIDLMIKDNRNPYELVRLFEQWRDSGKNPTWIPDFMRDHPAYDERIQIMKDEIIKDGFVR